jgi:hypothetical protein
MATVIIGGVSCDEYWRWPIKTMTDPQAGSVNLSPVSTTIIAERALPTPSPQPLPSEYPNRIGPTELATYTLTNVTLYRVDPPGSDQDIHILLEDAVGNFTVAEATNPACAAGSRVLSQMQTVRNFIAENWTLTPGTYVYPNVQVNVTGVGFYDPYTGEEHPTSGFEMHPVLSIAFAAPTPHPTPTGQSTSHPSPSASPSPSRTPTPTPRPSPSPSPTATPGPLTVSPSSLTFTNTRATSFTAKELHYTGQITEHPGKRCGSVITVSPHSGNGPSVTFLVTPIARGDCTIKVRDNLGQLVRVAVQVSL